MSITAITRPMPARQLGATSPSDGLWGYDQLPPPGIWRNMDTGQESTEDYNLPPGRWINSQGVQMIIDPPYQHGGPVDIKKPPFYRPYPIVRWNAPPGSIQNPPPAPVAPSTPAAADDGLWFGFEPTTLLWAGGGIAAAIAALYLASMPGGKNA